MTESASTEVEAVASAPTQDASRNAEIEHLHRTARTIAIVVALVSIGSFLAGRDLVEGTVGMQHLMGVALLGMSGSGVGALTSLLGRYAAGFKLESGVLVPPDAEGETYDRRIAFCFLARPALGLLVAPLIVGAIALFFKSHEDFKGSADAVMVVAFIGGLYAKSALEAAKNAFKVVFRA